MDQWILSTISGAGYIGIAGLMLLENLIPMIPSELILPFAGYLVSKGDLSLAGVTISGTLGSSAGATGWYIVGRQWGEERVRRWVERHGKWLLLDADDLDRADRWFQRHEGAATFFGRLIPGVRALISLPAGFTGMPWPRFLLYTVAGSAIWTLALAAAGYALADAYERARKVVGPVGTIVFGLLVLMLVVRYWRKHRGK